MPDKINQLKSIKEKEAKIMNYYKRNIIKNDIKPVRPTRKTRKYIKKDRDPESNNHQPDSKVNHDPKLTKLTKKHIPDKLDEKLDNQDKPSIGKSYEQIKAKQLEKNIVNMD